ncbi:MAG: hypothetical protein V4621_00335 [Pseudomonadota bacterium]
MTHRAYTGRIKAGSHRKPVDAQPALEYTAESAPKKPPPLRYNFAIQADPVPNVALPALTDANGVYRALMSYWQDAHAAQPTVISQNDAGKTRVTSWKDFLVQSDYTQAAADNVHRKWSMLAIGLHCSRSSHPIAGILPTHSKEMKHQERNGVNFYDLPLRQGFSAGTSDAIFVTVRLIVHPGCPLPEKGRDTLFSGLPSLVQDSKRPNRYYLVCDATDPRMIKPIQQQEAKAGTVVHDHPSAARQQKLNL